MMRKIRTFSGVAIVAALVLFGSTGSLFASVIGRYGGEFMAAGGGARSLAMGGAAVAVESEPWALFWNPAGLAHVTRPHLGLMHSERFAGVVDYDAVSYAALQPDDKVLAVGMIRLGVNGIPFTRAEIPGQPIGQQNRVEIDKIVSSGEYAFYAARAGNYTLNWSFLKGFGFDWGVAPKLIFKHIGSYRAYGIGLDAGISRRFGNKRWLSVGAAAKDVCGTVMAWEQTGRKEIIIPTASAGVAFGLPLPALEADLTFAADGSYRTESFGESSAGAAHLGFEYLVRKVFALRVGADDGEPTFGGGINLKPVSIDYAYIGHDQLGETHRISVTARWGGN